MNVAEMIRKTRTESGMTQEEYGVKFGVTRQTVSSWENDRSLPDLQMLIDICNTYHVSLDKLLNEDKDFVDQMDYYSRIKRILKKAAVLVLLLAVVFSGIFIRWKLIAHDKDEAFADAASQIGFVQENGGGLYVLRKDGVSFRLPNQKLPFLKEDFYVKNVYADFVMEDTEVGMAIYDGTAFQIELNHYRNLSGTIVKDGTFVIDENTLNRKEQRFYDCHEEEIREVLRCLAKIHDAVYTA